MVNLAGNVQQDFEKYQTDTVTNHSLLPYTLVTIRSLDVVVASIPAFSSHAQFGLVKARCVHVNQNIR